jgi:hypothetical protein
MTNHSPASSKLRFSSDASDPGTFSLRDSAISQIAQGNLTGFCDFFFCATTNKHRLTQPLNSQLRTWLNVGHINTDRRQGADIR